MTKNTIQFSDLINHSDKLVLNISSIDYVSVILADKPKIRQSSPILEIHAT